MGSQLEILIRKNETDQNKPYISKSFKNEIAFGCLWANRKPFLIKEEEDILAPKWDWLGLYETPITPINPSKLKAVLLKVSQYLQQNQQNLPLIHALNQSKENLAQVQSFAEGSFGELKIRNTKCWVLGDTYLYDEYNEKGLRYKFNIRSYPEENKTINVWLDVKNEIIIDNRKYYMRTITKYEQYRDMLNNIINYCDKALGLGHSVFWLYD